MSSVHHQMMIPGKTVHELLAWTNSLTLSRAGRMPQWDTSKVLIGLDFFKQEPEVVYFPKVNALAIQGHPEFMDEASKAVDYTQQLVRQKLFKEDIVIRLKENSVED
jgi:hypothetical protein